jgi:uncharacterized protein (TIGR03435 family)
MRIEGARVDIGLASLLSLIGTAYQVEPFQISGPNWMAEGRFDILANMPDGATAAQVPEMLQALLAERFKLVVRRESKVHPVYALEAVKGGPTLKEAEPDAGTSGKPFPKGAGGRKLLQLTHAPDGLQTISLLNGATLFETEKISLPELARVLMRYVDLPVVDMTGLKSFYEVAMDVPDWPNRSSLAGRGRAGIDSPADVATDPPRVSIFASVQKLGLRLEKRTAPIETIVIDHLEKAPTEN